VHSQISKAITKKNSDSGKEGKKEGQSSKRVEVENQLISPPSPSSYVATLLSPLTPSIRRFGRGAFKITLMAQKMCNEGTRADLGDQFVTSFQLP
jgi:hypothetical protein